MTDSASSTDSTTMPKLALGLRLLGWGVLLAVLAVGFAGYFLPGLRLNWETIAAMCGF